ncbi:hypothetical protein [Kitasatospora sp. NPDC047058]|uniref:hypothetical protein n=1 Tax=Kitasatospora sp. NPDC047058 TaxID=3155620 RepID=UPI0033C3E26B
MQTLAGADCGQVRESSWEYGLHSHEHAGAANAVLRRCQTCRGSIGGEERPVPQLQEKTGPDRLECSTCAQDRAARDVGPPTKREPDAWRFPLVATVLPSTLKASWAITSWSNRPVGNSRFRSA